MLKPLWGAPYEWSWVLFLIVFTYLVGFRAEITGNLDIIAAFPALLLYSLALICITITLVIDSMILVWIGVLLSFLSLVVGLIGYQKLSHMGFYSEIPTILEIIIGKKV